MHADSRLACRDYTFTRVFTVILNVSLSKRKSAVSRATALSENGFKTKWLSELWNKRTYNLSVWMINWRSPLWRLCGHLRLVGRGSVLHQPPSTLRVWLRSILRRVALQACRPKWRVGAWLGWGHSPDSLGAWGGRGRGAVDLGRLGRAGDGAGSVGALGSWGGAGRAGGLGWRGGGRGGHDGAALRQQRAV